MSTTFANSIDSNPIYADRAENDKDGNRIDQTYAKSASLATVATTGDYDDLSDKPDLSIYAETANLATVATTGSYDDLADKPTIPASQVNSDWNASSGVAEILNKPTLSTVATTGDYDDLVNKPSIPAAQVNADWNSSSGVSEILNKPTLAAVATSGDYGDLSNTPTINNVPAVTSNDDNKVLKASYTGGVGSYSWEAESGGTVTDVEVDGTSVVSGGVASITMPTELVPTVTSSDDGKVLKAAYSGGTGSYSWETESGGGGTQADWAEDDPLEPSYIENKPVPKTLVAGTNITISENSSTLTVSATWQNAQADWTETDPNQPAYIQHKPTLATVATSGDYTDLSNTPTVDQTYDASSANAQSGVAVADAIGNLPTNLSSAQIQALKEALGVDETVLYSGMETIGNDGAATYNLSESPLNFQYIKVYFCANDNTFGSAGNVGSSYTEWDTQIYTAPSTFLTVYMDGNASATAITKYAINCDVSGIQTSTWTAHGYLNDATGNAKWFHIFKIVGRHRIASN